MANLFDVHSLDQQPVVRSAMPPEYPYEMRRQGKVGAVDVDYIIDSEGNVVAAQVIRSTDEAFEMAAVNAVRRWKFRPRKKGGAS
ncbi:MAG: energy transducer TonB [Candidatus Didemnitutus sp.]|nr:energy transducer TonB [Candidatus Didemnitutus sp.]